MIENKTVASMPYMGGKAKLATKIINAIHDKVGDYNNFYDLFGGGAAVTIAALEAGLNVTYNELNTGIANLFDYIVKGGEIPNDWVSREQFHKYKHYNDWYGGYIKCVWSFGNNQRDYLYGRSIELIKKEAHEYLIANGYDGSKQSRLTLNKKFREINPISGVFTKQLQHLTQRDRLINLRKTLKSILSKSDSSNKLTISGKSYENVRINSGVIYCDIPYKGTSPYQLKEFNYNNFYQWCMDNNNAVFISEYNMPKEFIKVAEFKHTASISANCNKQVIEKLYWNGRI